MPTWPRCGRRVGSCRLGSGLLSVVRIERSRSTDVFCHAPLIHRTPWVSNTIIHKLCRNPIAGMALGTRNDALAVRQWRRRSNRSTPAVRSVNCDRQPGPCQAGRSLTDEHYSATASAAQDGSAMPELTTRFEWERLIRRARLQPSTKLVGLALSTYTNKDGSRAYPGVERLALVTGLSTKTVRNGLASLRQVGLVERTVEGSKNGRRGLADEYALRFPDHLERSVHMLDPTEGWDSEECSDACAHPGSPVTTSGVRSSKVWARRKEQGNSVPGSPVMSSRTGELSSTNTGNEFPPPSHHHPGDHDIHHSSDPVVDATPDGLLAELIKIDEFSQRRKGA